MLQVVKGKPTIKSVSLAKWLALIVLVAASGKFAADYIIRLKDNPTFLKTTIVTDGKMAMPDMIILVPFKLKVPVLYPTDDEQSGLKNGKRFRGDLSENSTERLSADMCKLEILNT